MSSNPSSEPSARPGRRWGPGRWSLRARLGAATAALLALGCLVVGVTTLVTLDRALYNRIDAQLNAAAARMPKDAPSTSDCSKPHKNEFPAGQAIGTLSARTCDGVVTNADVLVEAGQPRPDLSPYYPALLAIPAGAPPRTYDLGDLGEYRIVASTMPDGAIRLTGLPLAETEQTLHRVAWVVGGVMLLVLLSGGLAAKSIVRRALRPLSRVTATATRVSQLPLDRGEVDLSQRVNASDTDPRTEVGQVGAAFNRMLDHVGSALEARHDSELRVRQFVADASHELRTPLASIRGYAELSRRSGEPVPPSIDHMLRRVESEAQRMGVLVDDLLLLARLDSGRPLAREPVDLTALVVNAVSDAHAAGPRHDWRLDVPSEPVELIGDPARLHQVIANLLANARAHTPDGTIVAVAVSTQDSQAVLRVCDNGPGIPAELMPHIFERFARGDSSRSRKAGSSGLGLAIVQAVVTAHSGTIDVSSAPGRTEFVVRLPMTMA